MTVRDIASGKLAVIEARATVVRAAREMKERDVGLLAVVDGGRITGVVTDRDLVVRAVAAGLDPACTQVRRAASSSPVFCRSDATLKEAAALMERKKVRRLLVVDEENRPTGVVALSDLAARGGDEQLAGEVLAELCGALQGAIPGGL